jgi:beta-hydroxyacyl-ACP dehydratase FabZ
MSDQIIHIEDIMKVLPHRYPFLLIDKIIESNGKDRIVGIKNLTINEPFFQGHFPGSPVFPGVLQLEAMAQTGGYLLMQISETEGLAYFMAIDKAKFRRIVRPGDQLRIEIDFIKVRQRSAKFRGVCYVDGEIASEAELMCMVAPARKP